MTNERDNRSSGARRGFWIRFVSIGVFALAAFPASAASAVSPATASATVMHADMPTLQTEAANLKEENEGLQRMLAAQDDDDPYIVIDTEVNRLYVRKGRQVLRRAVAGTGSHKFVEAENGRSWYFATPIGSFRILAIERDPVWIRPNWSFVEENMPVPPPGDPDRIVRGVLGKYAFMLGNGYMIHGTTWTKLLGTHFTHGCINVGAADLDFVYHTVKIGTQVYIY